MSTKLGTTWVRITHVTLYYRDKEGSHFLGEFPLRMGDHHIDECHEEDDGEVLLSPSIFIHTSSFQQEIEDWSFSWREQSKKSNERWRDILIRGHSLCGRLEKTLNDYYSDQNRHFIVRLQHRPVYRLKLINEYSVDWPIWSCDIGKKDYEHHLSPQLKDRLTNWAANFNANFHTCIFQVNGWEGWKTKEEETNHWKEGRDLEDMLQRQLSAGDPSVDWDVCLNLWEK